MASSEKGTNLPGASCINAQFRNVFDSLKNENNEIGQGVVTFSQSSSLDNLLQVDHNVARTTYTMDSFCQGLDSNFVYIVGVVFNQRSRMWLEKQQYPSQMIR